MLRRRKSHFVSLVEAVLPLFVQDDLCICYYVLYVELSRVYYT